MNTARLVRDEHSQACSGWTQPGSFGMNTARWYPKVVCRWCETSDNPLCVSLRKWNAMADVDIFNKKGVFLWSMLQSSLFQYSVVNHIFEYYRNVFCYTEIEVNFGFAQNTLHDFQYTVLNSQWHCLWQMPQKALCTEKSWVNKHEMNTEPYSVKRCLNTFMKNIDLCQPAQYYETFRYF